MIGKPVMLTQIPNQRLFGVKAAALYLGLCEDTLRKYSDLGWIRTRRLDRRRVFTLEDLDAFIEALPSYDGQDYTGGGGKPVPLERRDEDGS